MTKKHKSGSYLVEAAMIMPIFILAVVMLMSGIPSISASEQALFDVTDEMRLESVKSAIRENPYVLPAKITGRVYLENHNIDQFYITSFQYLYEKNSIKDLISLQYAIVCDGNDILNIFDEAALKGKITARAFTGAVHHTAPKNEETTAKEVFIFPEWGNRYHHENCTFIRTNCRMEYLSQKIKQSYKPCELCNAKSAQIGSPVFCFQQYGEVYHLAECKTVERYYVAIKQNHAEQQGYSPCQKCNGGNYESKN